VLGHRNSFVVVAAFFALFAIPTFLFLRERGTPRTLDRASDYARVGFRRVGDTLTHLRRYREVGKFVLGALFFYGGIEAVIKFSAIYATVTFGFAPGDLVQLFLVTNVIAVPGTLAAGLLADWIGSRRALALTLVGWILLMFWGASTTTRAGFWLMAGGVAIGMGSTQAIARSYMALLSPRARESEFFGFYILAGKVGAILAFLLFGAISSGTGNQRTAVLWLLPLFVAGLALVLWSRPLPAAEAEAG
jgi:UMF1 family MFS transporter